MMTDTKPNGVVWADLFSQRIRNARTSFVREILKVTENPAIISFAGGLPSPELFPVEEIQEAANHVLRTQGTQALQYSTSEGYLPLRQWIAERYATRFGLRISPDEILITTGSQQALDLLGKVFIEPADLVLLERPGYLGAIQSFSIYQPELLGIESGNRGIDTDELGRTLASRGAKLLYTVPNFQNPSGATYDLETRRKVASLAAKHELVLIEDDPYGELRYAGETLPPMRSFNDNGILLGSFSKVVAPGLRLGWVCAPKEVIRRLVVAKQASDLHSDTFSQRMLFRFLESRDIQGQLEKIRTAYASRCKAMVEAFRTHMPQGSACNHPEGGMFLWATLPEGVSARALFERAIEKQVAFVPGSAFYVDGGGDHAMRLNFTNTAEARIAQGIRRLAEALGNIK